MKFKSRPFGFGLNSNSEVMKVTRDDLKHLLGKKVVGINGKRINEYREIRSRLKSVSLPVEIEFQESQLMRLKKERFSSD